MVSRRSESPPILKTLPRRRPDPILVCYGYSCGEVPLSEVPPTDTFVSITPTNAREEPARRRPVMVSLGCHVKGTAPPHPNPDDRDTVEAGVRKRFVREPPKPDRAFLAEFAEYVKEWLPKNLQPLDPALCDLDFESWLAEIKHPQSRKEELRRVHEATDGHLQRKHYVVKSFVKDETYPEYKHARAINSRTDAFKCAVGPIFHAIDNALFAHEAFIKKIPIADRPAYIRDRLKREGALYFEGDFESYEGCFMPEIMESCEFQLYEFMTSRLAGGKNFMKLVREVLAGPNHCVFKLILVNCLARRMSGEMCTSSGNSFTTLLLHLFLFSRLGENVKPIVEGDDSDTSFMKFYPSKEDYLRLGFRIKIKIHTCFEEMSFCGMVFDEQDLINVTDPREVLVEFGWARSVYVRCGMKKKMVLLRCKALSYLHQYTGCPIIQSLARYVLRVTPHYDVRHFIRESRLLTFWERAQLEVILTSPTRLPFKPIPPRTRTLVERMYNISPTTQIAVEEYLDGLNELKPLDASVIYDCGLPDVYFDYYERYSLIADRYSDLDYPISTWAKDHKLYPYHTW